MSLLLSLDLMARGGALALLALWSWILLRDHRIALAARIAVAMNATIACHVITTIPGAIGRGPIDALFEIGSASVPGLFWLFARTWFNDESRVGWRSWLLIVAPIPVVIVLMRHSTLQDEIFLTAITIMRASMFGFAIAGLWTAWRGRDGDLVETRRRFRASMIWTVGAFVILTNCIEMLVYAALIPNTSRHVIEAGILLLCFAFCAAMFVTRQRDLFAPAMGYRLTPAPKETATDQGADAPLAEKLKAYMQSERAWRDEALSISKLAAQLGEQEYRLRRTINGMMGHRNFAAFLSGYRLAEVKEALTDPSQREVPIITIALDAGFGSLGPFNRAFREAEGMTPSTYRTQQTG
jgi:AraC-like DNA-binding protein